MHNTCYRRTTPSWMHIAVVFYTSRIALCATLSMYVQLSNMHVQRHLHCPKRAAPTSLSAMPLLLGPKLTQPLLSSSLFDSFFAKWEWWTWKWNVTPYIGVDFNFFIRKTHFLMFPDLFQIFFLMPFLHSCFSGDDAQFELIFAVVHCLVARRDALVQPGSFIT